jgi:ParB-like chromosome segregation protein Spo0J
MNRAALDTKLTNLRSRLADARARLQAALERGNSTEPFRQGVALLEAELATAEAELGRLDAADQSDRQERMRQRALAIANEARADIAGRLAHFDLRRFS